MLKFFNRETKSVTNISEVKVGDRVTVTNGAGTVTTGVVAEIGSIDHGEHGLADADGSMIAMAHDEDGSFEWGETVRAGDFFDEVTVTAVGLPARDLPVIRATKVRGVEGDWMMTVDDDGDFWAVGENGIRIRIAGEAWHRPEHIEEWAPLYQPELPTLLN